MPLGQDWRADATNVLDLDAASRLASPRDTYAQQQLRVGAFPLGSFPGPENSVASQLGAGLIDKLGALVVDPQQDAETWAAMVRLDQNTLRASATGELVNGQLRYVLSATPIDGEPVTLTLTIGEDGRPVGIVEAA